LLWGNGSAGDVVAIDDTLEAASIERVIQLVRKIQIFATVGDEDAKLAPVERVGVGSLAAQLYHRVSANRMFHARRLPLRGSHRCTEY
jgi:hypothetical protein